ncbi:MAG: hypothetical protein JST00_27395 [Deltaproteobacteria bacterium]|nr:hypothetical protein [Deltaproteobacteria bacterium]
MKRHLASVAALTLLLAFALGSGGKDKSTGGEGGATSTATSTAGSTSSGGGAADKPTIIAVCNNPKKGTCDEYYEFLPTLVPEMCPGDGGEFKKGPGSCPTANLIGTCHYKSTKKGDPGQYAYHYANGAETHDSLKKDCEENTGSAKEWIEPPPSAKAAAPSASATGTPAAAKTGTPAAKPTGAAKPAATPSAKPKK